VSGSTLNLIPITQGVAPSEGSKAGVFQVNWGTTNPFGTFNINLLAQYQSGQFTVVQSVYIDNTTCPYQVTLMNQQTRQILRIPPFTKAMYPILSGVNPSYVATLNSVADPVSNTTLKNCSTSFFFTNSPCSPFEYRLPDYGNNFANVSTGATFTSANTNTITQIVPPQSANTHILINSIIITIVTDSTMSGENLVVTLAEMGTSQNGGPPSATTWSRFIFTAAILAPTNSSTPLFISFPVPIFCQNPMNGLGIAISNPITGTVDIDVTVNYGSVIVE
jgi:hypothetical protein